MNFNQVLPILLLGSLAINTQAHASYSQKNIDDITGYPYQMQLEFNKLKNECGYLSPNYNEKVPLYVNEGFISKADITGDGIDDYVVNYDKLDCEYSASMWQTGNNAPYSVYMGAQNGDAYLLYQQYNMDSENYPNFVRNNHGYYDIQRIGMGGDCGQEGNWSWAENQYCVITEHWNRDSNQLDLVSIINLSYSN